MFDYREINSAHESIYAELPWDKLIKVFMLDYREIYSAHESINVRLPWDVL